jgi:hypothetical protein
MIVNTLSRMDPTDTQTGNNSVLLLQKNSNVLVTAFPF